jgi:hypothetical protein
MGGPLFWGCIDLFCFKYGQHGGGKRCIAVVPVIIVNLLMK